MSLQIWTSSLVAGCTLSRVQPVVSLLSSPLLYLLPLLFLCLSGCCGKIPIENFHYQVRDSVSASPLKDFPRFAVQGGELKYNRIGTPELLEENGSPLVQVTGEKATLYYDEDFFITEKGKYNNRIYRIHFPEVPFSLCTPHLTAGNNPGLLIIYTYNQENNLVLITTVHTCGCYLAFLPTGALNHNSFPKNWPKESQSIYGHTLPAIVPLQGERPYTFALASGTHRVSGVHLDSKPAPTTSRVMDLQPMATLHQLPYKGGVVSFFETEGSRRGYVKNNSKPLERLLISWWAFDWHVGEDKIYESGRKDGPTFYTSLKFWQREASDMRDFPRFLRYWGWKL